MTPTTYAVPDGYELVEESVGAGKTSLVSLVRRTRDGERFAWKVPADGSGESRETLNTLVTRSARWRRLGIARGEARHAPDGVTVLQPWVEGTSLRKLFRESDLLTDPDDAHLAALAEMFTKTASARVSVSGLNSENLLFDGEQWLVVDSGAIREWRTPWRAWATQRKKIVKHWIRWDGHDRDTVRTFVRRIEARLDLPKQTLADRLILVLRGRM